jgi:hypothetical protein
MSSNTESLSRTYGLAAVHCASLFIHKALPWILAVILLHVVAQSALAFLGTDSLLGAWLELTSNMKVTRGFAFIFGGIGLLFGMQQRRIRQLEQAQFSVRISELEHEISRKSR